MLQQPRALTRFTVALVLAAAVGGCDSGTEPPRLDFDAVAVENSVLHLLVPLEQVREPTAVLEDAFETLRDQGLVFDRATPTVARALEPLGAVDPGSPLAVEIPSEMLGQTFVYDTNQEDWVADTTRTGAPADGVRVIWYEMNVAGNFAFPLTEKGYIDVTDEDTETLNQLGIMIVDTVDVDVVVAEMTQAYATSGDVEWTEHFESAGFYRSDSASVSFELASDASGNTDTGEEQFDFTIDLQGAEATYTMTAQGTESSEGDLDQNVQATVVSDVTTTLDLELLQDGSNQTGTGQLTSEGSLIVDVAFENNDFSYTGPDGESVPSGQAFEIDNLVTALYFAGFEVLLTLPLLFLPAVTA